MSSKSLCCKVVPIWLQVVVDRVSDEVPLAIRAILVDEV